MKEAVQSVFLILGATGEHGMVDHTIVEMPSRNAGDIVGQALSAQQSQNRWRSGDIPRTSHSCGYATSRNLSLPRRYLAGHARREHRVHNASARTHR